MKYFISLLLISSLFSCSHNSVKEKEQYNNYNFNQEFCDSMDNPAEGNPIE